MPARWDRSPGTGSRDQRPAACGGAGAGRPAAGTGRRPARYRTQARPLAVRAAEPAQPAARGPAAARCAAGGRCGRRPSRSATGGERVAGDAAGPGEVPQRAPTASVRRHWCLAAGDARAAAGRSRRRRSPPVLEERAQDSYCSTPGSKSDWRVQRQRRGIGQMQADPAVVAGQSSRRRTRGFRRWPSARPAWPAGSRTPAPPGPAAPTREAGMGTPESWSTTVTRRPARAALPRRSAKPGGTGRRWRGPPVRLRRAARRANGGGSCAAPRRRTTRSGAGPAHRWLSSASAGRNCVGAAAVSLRRPARAELAFQNAALASASRLQRADHEPAGPSPSRPARSGSREGPWVRA